MTHLATYLRLGCLLTLLGACQREPIVPTATHDIVGEWQWVSSVGGIGGLSYTPASTLSQRKWVFRADSTLQEYEARQGAYALSRTTRFSLHAATSLFTNQPVRALFLGSSSQPAIYLLTQVDGQLVLDENNPDGFRHTYRRQ